MTTSGSYEPSPTMPRIDGCPDGICAATQLCLAPGDCYADQFVEPERLRRAISVRQPWAWALIHGGKDVENRGRRDPWVSAIGERVFVHAAKTPEPGDECEVARLARVRTPERLHDPILPPDAGVLGALIGSVVVRDVHHANRCGAGGLSFCSSWAQPDQWHIAVVDPVPLPRPIAWRGALGLFSVAMA